MKLLFICTHNRCRSILAEAITNHYAESKLEAKSAGSAPVSAVHPLTLKFLSQAGIKTQGLCSQSWDEHESWQPDVVITVCDSAAGEACPAWFGDAIQVHWGLADPSSIDGSDKEVADAFMQTIETLSARIKHLLEINLKQLSDQEVHASFVQVIDI